MVLNLSSLADKVTSDESSKYLKTFHPEVIAFGSWRKSSTPRINNFIVSEFEISYLSKGRLTLTTPQGSFQITEGALFLFEPFVPYSVEKTYDGDMDLYNLFFDIHPEYRHGELLSRILHPERPVWYAGELPDLSPLFLGTYERVCESTKGNEILAEMLLKSCLVYMLRAADAHATTALLKAPHLQNRQNTLVRHAIQYISAHLTEPIKLYELCQALSVSESYLYKCFIKIVGVSPQKYLIQRKVQRARRLMRFEGYTVEQAAGALGFSSPYHLSSLFKSVFGKAPTQYLETK